MPHLLQGSLVAILVWAFLTPVAHAQDRASVIQRVRAELAVVLKKEPATLSVDKPVLDFGADELDVVEWVMAVEEAFRVEIREDQIVDSNSKKTRKDLSIASMAKIVSDALPSKAKKK
jgi:acyl carrier protein